MLIDSRNLSTNETIHTDICIVGSGPAGLTLAREFLDQNFRVCLLESGDIEADKATQELCQGETAGDSYPGLEGLRRRQCGGTANVWDVPVDPAGMGVRYVPLDPSDFEKRDWVPHSGWPFDRAHLDPFYERAQSICRVSRSSHTGADWADEQSPELPLIGNRVTTTIFQLSSAKVFLEEYRQQIIHSQNVTLYRNANVVELETNETAQTVTGVRAVCLSGLEFRVSAKIVILAAGGFENARLLLLSNRTQSAGLANQYDQVGRYFMDHPLIRTGMFIPSDRNLFNLTSLYDVRPSTKTLAIQGTLTLSDEARQAEKILHMCASIFPRYPIYQSEAVAALKRLVKTAKKGRISSSLLQDLGKVIMGIGDFTTVVQNKLLKPLPLTPEMERGGWSQYSDKATRFGFFDVFSSTEQAPDPDNRLMLSNERDRLGCPKVKLQWRWREIDIQSVKRNQEILAEEIAKAGLGELLLAREGNLPQLITPAAHHPMGGTRMHVDPKQGVVDENCKVHGLSNLFIAGSSVFPTGGFANPTLTIIALAIRLADEVKQTMALSQITAV